MTSPETTGAAAWLPPATPRLQASVLTPQQREIALLAAAGLSSKQIGARLFLSPRTVSAHLYELFRKLGVTSRAALRDALNGSAGSDAMADRTVTALSDTSGDVDSTDRMNYVI